MYSFNMFFNNINLYIIKMGGSGSKSNTDLNSKIMVELMNKIANNFNSEINNYINNNASLSIDVTNT